MFFLITFSFIQFFAFGTHPSLHTTNPVVRFLHSIPYRSPKFFLDTFTFIFPWTVSFVFSLLGSSVPVSAFSINTSFQLVDLVILLYAPSTIRKRWLCLTK